MYYIFLLAYQYFYGALMKNIATFVIVFGVDRRMDIIPAPKD